MANIAVLLIARAFADREGDSNRDSMRVALPAAFINPPVLGLVVATALARRDAPAVAPANKGSGLVAVNPNPGVPVAKPTHQLAGHGGAIFDAAGIPRPKEFFPSFLGYSHAQARRVAEREKLQVVVSSVHGGTSLESHEGAHSVVVRQEPAPGAEWHHDANTVHLQFGKLVF